MLRWRCNSGYKSDHVANKVGHTWSRLDVDAFTEEG